MVGESGVWIGAGGNKSSALFFKNQFTGARRWSAFSDSSPRAPDVAAVSTLTHNVLEEGAAGVLAHFVAVAIPVAHLGVKRGLGLQAIQGIRKEVSAYRVNSNARISNLTRVISNHALRDQLLLVSEHVVFPTQSIHISAQLLVQLHPQSVDSSGYRVPGDRQRKQSAPQSLVDAVVKNMLVGVIVRKGNAVALNNDALVLQDGPHFVDDDLHLSEQAAFPPSHGDMTVHPVVGEVG